MLVDSESDNRHLPTCVDEFLARCEVCQAFEKAPRAPVAETSTVATFNEKLQADLLFLDDIIALRVMGVFSEYSLLIPVRTKSPGKFGMPFAAHGLEFSAHLAASRWMRAGNGRMKYGQSCVQNGEPNCLFKGSARTPGFWNDATVWLAAFTIDRRKTIDSGIRRFPRRYSGA